MANVPVINVNGTDYNVKDLTAGEIVSSMNETDYFHADLWENGSISATTGANASNSSRIRTRGYLPWTAYKLRSTNTDVRFLIYAYTSDGTYVGGWYDTEFRSNDVKGVSSIDLRQFYNNAVYSAYQFRCVILINSGTARVDTITGIMIDNFRLRDMFTKWTTLSDEYAVVLPNGTDFNDLTTPGNYFVENYSQISTHSNYPPRVANGGRLFVFHTIARSRYAQLWISYPSGGEAEIWMRNYTGTVWNKWYRVNEPAERNIRVIGYNIGKFNWGQDGGLSTNVDEKIANYKRFFGEVNPDVMLFAELSEYIDSGETYETDSTLTDPLFSKKADFHECAVRTNLISTSKIDSDGGKYLRDNNSDYSGSVSRVSCMINNKKTIFAGGFLRVLSSASSRAEAFQNFLTEISDYEYAVLYLDTNVGDETERANIYNIATNAGYTVANGGYFGTVDTLVPTSAYKKIDNIFVKGNIKIKNFYAASDEYDNLSSDHIPIIADLTLY